ncbi:AAA family ATPase [Vibrio sp.]|nr:AAA family ATPase [Vibrio sp.]
MSSANSLRVLELESQVEVLERLQLLSNFGSSLVTVTGVEGAGKTWIAQRFLEAWAEDKNQALLMCFPNQDDEQRRATILSQLSSQSYFDPTLSLSDTITEFYGSDSCNIVIVVDDAQLLSEALISELWMLVLESQSRTNWSINVVLFSLPNLLDPLLTRLSYGQEQKPVDVEIDLLSDDDADRFFEFHVMRYVEPNLEKRVRNAYSKVRKTPGNIMALGEQKMEKRVVIRSIIGSPINIAIIILLLLLLIGGGYYWMLRDGIDPAAVLGKREQTAIPTLSDEAQENDKETDPLDGSGSTLEDGVNDDSNALPPDVAETKDQVGIEDSNQKRVVISSDVVDALIGGEQPPAVEDTQDQAPESKPIHMDQSAEADAVQTPSAPQADVNHSQPTAEQKTAQDISFSFARDELMAMSDRSYTLQLGAFNTLPEVEKFIEQYKLQGEVNVYPTTRNEQQWLIVTYKNYPTIQSARDAVASLSSEIQRLGPWAKSLRQVHREIERAK